MASNQNFTNFTFNQNGVIIPDTNDLKTDVQQEFLDALGSDLSLEDSTPQGRLIDIETNSRQDVINFTATVANAICNAQKSGGSILDNWLSNFNIQRGTSRASTVAVIVTGLPNTIIPVGAQAQDVNGNIWLNESEIVIGDSGVASGVFYSQEQGAIVLEANQLNKIVSGQALGVNGWQSINNSSPAIEGATVMDDYGAQFLLSNCLFRGTALFGNYKSTVLKNVPNTLDCFTKENPYDEILPFDNIELAKHSVYVAVLGGEAQEIGQQLFYIKSAGCNWNGNTTVTAKDLVYNTSSPVTFQIPSGLPLAVQIEVTNLNSTSDNLKNEIQEVISNYFNNSYASSGYPAPYIRGIINPYTLTQVLISNITGITVNSLLIAPYNPPDSAQISIIQGSELSNATVEFDTFKSQISTNGNYNFNYGIDYAQSSATVEQIAGIAKATGSITILTNPAQDCTVSIGSTAFNLSTTQATAGKNVKIGNDSNATAQALATQINQEQQAVTAQAQGNVITLTANKAGVEGNSIYLTSTLPADFEIVQMNGGVGIQGLNINASQFFTNFSASGEYTFTMLSTISSIWLCEQDGQNYTLAQLGIAYTGEAETGSQIQVNATAQYSWKYISENIELQTYGINVEGSPQYGDILNVILNIYSPKVRATSEIVKSSVTSGIYWAHVDTETFASQVTQSGVYSFVYDSLNQWSLNYQAVNLDDYGISISGQPLVNDKINITFNNGKYGSDLLPLYCTEYPTIASENIYVSISNNTPIYS